MPRDYKHRAQRKRKPVSPWLGMIAGLLIGLFIAFLVYLQILLPQSGDAGPGDAGIANTQGQQDVRDEHKEKKNVIPPPPPPRFDFYTILPEMEVVVPEREIEARTKPGVKQVEQAGTFLLQIGSFKSFEQADRLKAKLSLLGFETDTQKVTINGKDTFYRVRVGPFPNLGILEKARANLRKKGYESIPIRITG
jgi:cell division protein FtsN